MSRGRRSGGWFGRTRRSPPVEPPRFWGEKTRKRRWRRYLPMWGGAVAAGLVVGSMFGPLPGAGSGEADPIAWDAVAGSAEAGGAAGPFGLCHTGGGRNCVVDGDTIWLEGENIRIADIDTPETHEPRCAAEKRLGELATRRLHELVNSGTVSLESIGRDTDVYGRKLRRVLVDGTNVGETLVEEGLARPYGSGRRSWCA